MKTYLVGMTKEQWVSYKAHSAEEAKEMAQLDHPEWLVVGANDA